MFEVFYRCVYRDYWYEVEGGPFDFYTAQQIAMNVRNARNTPVVVRDAYGNVVMSL